MHCLCILVSHYRDVVGEDSVYSSGNRLIHVTITMAVWTVYCGVNTVSLAQGYRQCTLVIITPFHGLCRASVAQRQSVGLGDREVPGSKLACAIWFFPQGINGCRGVSQAQKAKELGDERPRLRAS